MRTRKCFRFFALFATLLAFAPAAAAQKAERWVEVRSPNFIVYTNGSEKDGRRAAEQFEQFRLVFNKLMPKIKVSSGRPLLILAVKNENGLKALLPEYWERKGQAHPAGVFQAGQEKNYVALRMDMDGPMPFQVIYHEYVHSLMRLNFRVLPVWISEGLAELFGNTTMGDREAGVGRVRSDQIEIMRHQKMIPLEALFTADHKSPFYNESSRVGIFYSQSWALTHYFFLGEQGKNFPKLGAYLDAVNRDVDSLEAARAAFGDLRALEKEIQRYVRDERYYYYPVKADIAVDEKTFPARELSPAESLAVRGDFYLHTQRRAEARTALEEALRLDPANAEAHASLGLLLFRENQNAEAARHFDAAMRGDTKSYLAHFYAARLKMSGSMEEAEKHLRAAVQLNPQFAPAYSILAFVLSSSEKNLEEALQHAIKAAQLEPGEFSHHLNVAQVLIRMERAQEAMQVAERVMANARKPEDQARAMQILESARSFQNFQATRKQYEQEAVTRREQIEKRAAAQAAAEKAEIDSVKPRLEAAAQAAAAAKPAKRGVEPKVATGMGSTVEGKITEAFCVNRVQLIFALDIGGRTLNFRAPNYYDVVLESLGWAPPDNFQPCTELKGFRARVAFEREDDTLFFGIAKGLQLMK